LPDGYDLSLTVCCALCLLKRKTLHFRRKKMDRRLLGRSYCPRHAGFALPQPRSEFFHRTASRSNDTLQNADRFEPSDHQIRQRLSRCEDRGLDRRRCGCGDLHSIPLLGRNNEVSARCWSAALAANLFCSHERLSDRGSVGVAALLIGLILTWWISRRITRPIEELAEARAMSLRPMGPPH